MSGTLSTDIVVIGAGPAGLAAATAAARSGASVILLDGFPRAGGQYYMQPVADDAALPQAVRGREAIDAALGAGVRLITGHEVFAAYPGFRLFAAGPSGPLALAARTVITATGAHDRVMAFPGWTLPGVMTAGAGQRLAKIDGVLPGKRLVIAGSGVFLWAVAQSLLLKGAKIAALVEARQPGFGLAGHLATFPERWGEVFNLVSHVMRRVDRVIWGRMVREAHGNGRLEGITIAAPDGRRSETIGTVDALLVSHGFQPNIEITALLDCAHRYEDALGGWHAVTDHRGRTTVAGVYAVGEVTGIAGAKPAMLSGEIAGLAAAAGLGSSPTGSESAIASLFRRLQRARRFGHRLGELFAPLSELAGAMRDDTILCRCEEVSRADVLAACHDGADSIHAAKIWTRAGMGRCQGRICRMSVTACIAAATGHSPEAIGFNRPRVPTRPVPIDDVLAAIEAGSATP